MSITGMSITFILTWWMSFFIILPIDLRAKNNKQSLKGKNHAILLKGKFLLATILALIIWAIIIIVLSFNLLHINN